MNIYEEQYLEKKLNELSDQLGLLLVDVLLASIKKISTEHMILSEVEECTYPPPKDGPPF